MTLLTAEGAYRRALELLRCSGALLRMPFAELATAQHVAHPDGRQHSWMLPLVDGGGLMIGFMEISTSGTLLRTSEFGEPQALAAWTDIAEIREAALAHVRKGEELGDPVLTYDTVPARLSWAVPVTRTGEREATVYVTGAASYRREVTDDSQARLDGIG